MIQINRRLVLLLLLGDHRETILSLSKLMETLVTVGIIVNKENSFEISVI